jgi:MFS family permease
MRNPLCPALAGPAFATAMRSHARNMRTRPGPMRAPPHPMRACPHPMRPSSTPCGRTPTPMQTLGSSAAPCMAYGRSSSCRGTRRWRPLSAPPSWVRGPQAAPSAPPSTHGADQLRRRSCRPDLVCAHLQFAPPSPPAGAFFGTFLGGALMLRHGRRVAIAAQAAFFAGGPILMAAARGPGCGATEGCVQTLRWAALQALHWCLSLPRCFRRAHSVSLPAPTNRLTRAAGRGSRVLHRRIAQTSRPQGCDSTSLTQQLRLAFPSATSSPSPSLQPSALVAGRLVIGLGIGASATAVPAYLAEVAPARSRGAVVQVYEVRRRRRFRSGFFMGGHHSASTGCTPHRLAAL